MVVSRSAYGPGESVAMWPTASVREIGRGGRKTGLWCWCGSKQAEKVFNDGIIIRGIDFANCDRINGTSEVNEIVHSGGGAWMFAHHTVGEVGWTSVYWVKLCG